MRAYTYKIYPNQRQIAKLEFWLSVCCWLYNQMLEMRIKAYRRRKESVSCARQCSELTQWRKRIDRLRAAPADFERDMVRRLEKSFQAFFRRVKAGDHPGFPRFKSIRRFHSMEHHDGRVNYVRGPRMFVPSLGEVRCRGRQIGPGQQKSIRIIRKPSGWYAQITVDELAAPLPGQTNDEIGIDVGLASFATLSNGEVIENPRFLAKSARRLRALQRRVSRRIKGSSRRIKAIRSLARQHEAISDQRRTFCHQHSTALVRKYDLIAVEKLNIKGMVRSRFGKSISDAAWSTFLGQLRVKAEWAGRRLVEVDARYSSQECPNCGAIKPKKLSERTHSCACGLVCQRDHAAAQVILARALRIVGANRPWTEMASGAAPVAKRQVNRKKREGRTEATIPRAGRFPPQWKTQAESIPKDKQ